MIQDIQGQPQAGVIGGLRDLLVDVQTVTQNLFRPYGANISTDGQTSTEQGADHDPMLVSLSEVLTPDRSGNAVAQAVPWVALAIFAVIGYFVVRKF